MTAPLRLTHTVKKGGCAAKIAAGTLTDLLRSLPVSHHPDLLVGRDLFDDAAVWRVSDDVAMIQTLDFFTPILDDPRDFGAVAAANALSDVFAMGGTPVTALTILAYPLDTLPPEVLQALMAGAIEDDPRGGRPPRGRPLDRGRHAEARLQRHRAGPPRAALAQHRCPPGDVLLLTKAVGTGTLAGARKNDEIDAEAMEGAIASMRQVNRLDLPPGLHAAVHAATDVTGFGLLGHALHVAQGSGVTLRIDAAAVPRLPGAEDTLRRGILTKAHGSNTRYVGPTSPGATRSTRWRGGRWSTPRRAAACCSPWPPPTSRRSSRT
jgi:selenide, water dikinase